MIVLCVYNLLLLCLLTQNYSCQPLFYLFPPTSPDTLRPDPFTSQSIDLFQYVVIIFQPHNILFELSSLSLRLDTISVDLCPRASDLILGVLFFFFFAPLNSEGLIFYVWFEAPLLCSMVLEASLYSHIVHSVHSSSIRLSAHSCILIPFII